MYAVCVSRDSAEVVLSSSSERTSEIHGLSQLSIEVSSDSLGKFVTSLFSLPRGCAVGAERCLDSGSSLSLCGPWPLLMRVDIC